MIDGEKIFRAAVDEPAPPPPPEAAEDEDDGHHIHVHCPLVIVLDDGTFTANGPAGALLVGWGWLASAWTLWCFADWLWGGMTPAGVAGALIGGIVFAVAYALLERRWRRKR